VGPGGGSGAAAAHVGHSPILAAPVAALSPARLDRDGPWLRRPAGHAGVFPADGSCAGTVAEAPHADMARPLRGPWARRSLPLGISTGAAARWCSRWPAAAQGDVRVARRTPACPAPWDSLSVQRHLLALVPGQGPGGRCAGKAARACTSASRDRPGQYPRRPGRCTKMVNRLARSTRVPIAERFDTRR